MATNIVMACMASQRCERKQWSKDVTDAKPILSLQDLGLCIDISKVKTGICNVVDHTTKLNKKNKDRHKYDLGCKDVSDVPCACEEQGETAERHSCALCTSVVTCLMFTCSQT